MTSTSTDLNEKLAAAKTIAEYYKVERFVYISIIVVCLIILLVSIGFSLVRQTIGPTELTPMFGSGGSIAFLTGRLLHMWNRTMSSVLGAPEKDE